MLSKTLSLGLLFLGLTATCSAQTSVPSSIADDTAKLQLNLSPTLNALRVQAQSQNWSFIPQVTGVSGRSLKSLTGENPPTPQQLINAPAVGKQAKEVLRLYKATVESQGGEAAPPACPATAQDWDWRSYGKVTDPELQQCGDCWSFATKGQIESAFLMAGWPKSDLAPQHILDCSNSGDCNGGTRWTALPWATTTLVADEPNYRYEGAKNSICKRPENPGTHQLVAAGWIDTSEKVPTTATLKQALCDYGPISVSIYASPALQSYKGGVFDENANDNGTNHAILLIGWDDKKQAWLIKNSWGQDWGLGGFGWVKYGSNNVGRRPVWAKAPKPGFKVSEPLKLEMTKLRTLAVEQDLR